MNIFDNRETSAHVPAREIIQEIVDGLEPKYLRGIRQVALLDKSYAKGPKLSGAYYADKHGKTGRIELYLDHYNRLPDKLKDDYHYLRFRITSTFCHELYHHYVHVGIVKHPKKKAEEQKADRWSDRALKHLFSKWYTPEEFREHQSRIDAILVEHEAKKG